MFKPTAIIFDLDGVLINTVDFHYAGWSAVARELGVAFFYEDNDKLRGVSRKEALHWLARDIDGLSKEREEYLLNLKAKVYYQHVSTSNNSIMVSGSKRLLEDLRSRNILIGLASASRHAPQLLDITGLAKMFDAVSDGNFPGKPKPAPDQLLALSRYLDVSPDKCIVVEDSLVGLEAAHRAGMHSLAIGDTCAHTGITNLFLPSLSGVSAEGFLSLISRSELSATVCK